MNTPITIPTANNPHGVWPPNIICAKAAKAFAWGAYKIKSPLAKASESRPAKRAATIVPGTIPTNSVFIICIGRFPTYNPGL